MPKIHVKQLLEAGVHFGHQTKRWNPKMRRFIFGERNGIYIIDLAKTMAELREMHQYLQGAVADGGTVLFVGTKQQAQDPIRDAAQRCGQYYVTHRWLGGTLTNIRTIQRSIKRMHELDQLIESDDIKRLGKKQEAKIRRELFKLHRNLDGIAKMAEPPAAMFVIDIKREAIAVNEARRLNIPVIALVDTNCDPDLADYPIPGNDDAIRAIRLIANYISDIVIESSDHKTKAAPEVQAEEFGVSEEEQGADESTDEEITEESKDDEE